MNQNNTAEKNLARMLDMGPVSPIWVMPMFYLIPRELFTIHHYLKELPRNFYQVLQDDKCVELLMSRAVEEQVMDSYCNAIWLLMKVPDSNGNYRQIPGRPTQYTGDFPIWILANHITSRLREKLDRIGYSVLSMMDMYPPVKVMWRTTDEFTEDVAPSISQIIEEQNYQPIIDAVWQCRDPADYEGSSTVRQDVLRTWNHSRSKWAKPVSLEECLENERSPVYSISDTSCNVEAEVIAKDFGARFLATLSDRDRQIARLRYEGYTHEEIAKKLEYKNHSGVVKRMDAIRKAFDKYQSEQ